MRRGLPTARKRLSTLPARGPNTTRRQTGPGLGTAAAWTLGPPSETAHLPQACVGQMAGGRRAAVTRRRLLPGPGEQGLSPRACSQGTSPLGSANRLYSFQKPRPPLSLSSCSDRRGRVPLGTA